MSVSTGSAPIHSFRAAVDLVATTIFCLAALSLGWWLGARTPAHSEPAPAAEPVLGRYLLCTDDSDCDAYKTYLETERARALAWRHGGP